MLVGKASGRLLAPIYHLMVGSATLDQMVALFGTMQHWGRRHGRSKSRQFMVQQRDCIQFREQIQFISEEQWDFYAPSIAADRCNLHAVSMNMILRALGSHWPLEVAIKK